MCVCVLSCELSIISRWSKQTYNTVAGHTVNLLPVTQKWPPLMELNDKEVEINVTEIYCVLKIV